MRGYAFFQILILGVFTVFEPLLAQGLESRIESVIASLQTILNIVIVGLIAWSGFLIAKGEGTGISRLIYGILGLVVVNAAGAIVRYFLFF